MKKYIDILIVPQGQEPSFNFRLSSIVARIVIFLVALWMISLIAATIFYGKISYRAMEADLLENENEKLRDYSARVVEIERSFNKNQKLVAKIASLAGIEIDDMNSSYELLDDSLQIDTANQETVAGFIGDIVPLSTEELEKFRIPQGRPLYGWITRGFNNGEDGQEKHLGIDIAVREGTPIVVTATGVVVLAGWDDAFGNIIMVDHENGYKTVYGHNQKMMTSLNEKVYKGDVIALSGNTGRSSAPHLHYEILKDNIAIDPSPFLD
ncbi:MAG: peptidoglycan DD-metalloendopeptidase family protein [candidate division Zixibacteria bacterium]|nr:peptidoglycan DD-metalloendopeptidase family protein [candidate division Zixibacteria bacterium]